MSRMAELAAELPPDDGNAALHFDVCNALSRVAKGTSTADDARLLCYALNVPLEDIGLIPKHHRSTQ